MLGPYHEHVRRELQSFGGTVEKFIGDAIMAVFGAPTAFGDDAERAVRGALAVRDSTLELDARELHLDLQLRIAVNTGEALVSLGARMALGESLVAGDVVNTAVAAAERRAGERRDRRRRDVRGHEGCDRVRAGRAGEAKGKSAPVEAWVARAPAPRRRRAAARGELVGRERELDVLRGIWERVSGERVPHLVTVIGPAGIGKTRLTQEFERASRSSAVARVHGRSLPYRESSAYFASRCRSSSSAGSSTATRRTWRSRSCASTSPTCRPGPTPRR